MTKRTAVVAAVAAVAIAAVAGVATFAVALDAAPVEAAAYASKGKRSGNGHGTAVANGTQQVHEAERTHATPDTSQPLTTAEAEGLQYMREEEKLARDVYAALAEKYDLRIFTNIAASESRHTTAVKTFLDAFDVTDPAAEDVPGSFVNTDLAALYSDLIAQGDTSLADALRVGIAIEEKDIADLQERMAATDRADLDALYANLLAASQNHLSAFTRQLAQVEG